MEELYEFVADNYEDISEFFTYKDPEVNTSIITVRTPHGILEVSLEGQVLRRTAYSLGRDVSAWGFRNIVQLDLTEWCYSYPEKDATIGQHELMDFGYWNTKGEYTRPVYSWRNEQHHSEEFMF